MIKCKKGKVNMDKAKLEKYREERGRYLEKIASYQKRVRALDQKIMEGENLEIRALMKGEDVTLEELTALVRQMQEQRPGWEQARQAGRGWRRKPDEAASVKERASFDEAPEERDIFSETLRIPETSQPAQSYEQPYAQPAYAATFNDLEDDE